MRIISLLGACVLLFECVTAHAGLGKWSQDVIPYNGFDTSFNSIAVDQLGRIYAGTDFGAYASSDGGVTWIKILDTGAWAVSVHGNGVYIGSGCNILTSFDGGTTWSSSTKLGNSPYCLIFDIAFDSRGGIYAMAQSAGLYKSNDDGSTWVNIGTEAGLVNMNFAAITVDRFDNIYVGVNQAYVYNTSIPGGVFKSTDGGLSWTRTTTGIDDIQFVTSVKSDFDGNVYAVTSPRGILKGDGGTSWSDVNTGLPSASAPYSLAIDSSGTLYVGTRSGNGVYKINGGHEWAAIDAAGWSALSIASSGLAIPGIVNTLAIDTNGTVYAGGSFTNSTHSITTTPFLIQYTPASSTLTAVEFHNIYDNRFFWTADENEAAAIDRGDAGPGYKRTGGGWNLWKTASGISGAVPICRFRGNPAMGNGSHFYTIDQDECDQVKNNAGWIYENTSGYAVLPSNGSCPNGLVPLARAYNASLVNHRFMNAQDQQSTYQDSFSMGWKLEGVAFCVTSANSLNKPAVPG